MSAIVLEEHLELFRSHESLDQFAEMIKVPDGGHGTKTVWWKNQRVATLNSLGDSRAILEERIRRRVTEDPKFLDEIKDRLENDPIVD